MKATFRKFGFAVVIAAIVFCFAACSDGSGDNGGGRWRVSRYKQYTVTNGVAGSVSSETVYNWIIYRYTSDTNYEQKYTVGSTTYHYIRNGQTYVSTTEAATGTSTDTYTYTYDSATGLTSSYKQTQTTTTASGTTTTTSEGSYNIDLLSENGGVKTYKVYCKTLTSNNTSIDVSTQGYSEYKIQNGRTLEQKTFTAAGVLQLTTTYTYDNNGRILEQKEFTADGVLQLTFTYTYSDDPVIRAKLGNYTWISSSTTGNSYQTVEVLSDSATELVIRTKSFTNDVLSSQTDTYYEKVN